MFSLDVERMSCRWGKAGDLIFLNFSFFDDRSFLLDICNLCTVCLDKAIKTIYKMIFKSVDSNFSFFH